MSKLDDLIAEALKLPKEDRLWLWKELEKVRLQEEKDGKSK